MLRFVQPHFLSLRRPFLMAEELPEFQLVVYSHNQCVVRLAIIIPSKIIHLAMTTSTSRHCNEYMLLSCPAFYSDEPYG